jgi:glycosyltransferase involved in cell wall biosynthesis/uncharacterized membrane protein YbhN (UPF0104 family)
VKARARVRFALSWVAAVVLLVAVVPRAVDVSWRGVAPLLVSVHWPTVLALVGLWFLGLWVHTFVLTAAAPSLTHGRALTLNLTGSAVSNVVPLGGAAGVELNRRMMRGWGIDGHAFAGYTFVTNLWDVGSKLLLPVIAVVALTRAGEDVSTQVRTASLVAGAGFVVVAVGAGFVLASPRGPVVVGRFLERWARRGLRLVGRDRELGIAAALAEVRGLSAGLVAQGWPRLSAGIAGYVALQGLLLGLCLHVTHAGTAWPAVLAAFAVERALTVVPITPGGVGVADLGLVGVLLTLGGDPAAVAGAALLYRTFVFALEIPVGSGALGAWLLAQRLAARRQVAPRPVAVPARRVAHVTDVFLPRLGGIETHVDGLARHQRAAGLDAEVLTPPRPEAGPDPGWVHRVTSAQARRAVTGYDVVHVHVSLFSPFGIGVARAAARAGVPTLVTVHSMWRGAGGILRLAALAGLPRWPVAWSAVSGVAATTFGRSLGGVDVAVLPNAVDVAVWRPPARGGSAAAPPQADAPVTLVSVMRLMPRKRPLQLVRVFERVRRATGCDDLRLVIVGDGPLRNRVVRRVRRRGLAEHVRVTGRLTPAAVREELLAASVYVAPAPKESFGLAALEARCAGLPVVASRGSGVAEFVRDGIDGRLVDGDAHLAAALAELVRDPGLRDRLAAHNRAVAPAFDWSDVLDLTSSLYATAAQRVQELPAPVAVPAALALEA